MYLDNSMKINENMSIDYTHNSPTLVINKPSDKDIALNFPSVDYVEKPSNNFTLTINDLIADTAEFTDGYVSETIFQDKGRFGIKNQNWALTPDLDNGYTVNENYTELYSTVTHNDCYACPIMEFRKDDDFVITFDYIHTSLDNRLCFIDDFNEETQANNIDAWTMSDLGISGNGKIRITKNDDVLKFYLNGSLVATETFTLDDDFRFYFNFNDNIFRFKNLKMNALLPLFYRYNDGVYGEFITNRGMAQGVIQNNETLPAIDSFQGEYLNTIVNTCLDSGIDYPSNYLFDIIYTPIIVDDTYVSDEPISYNDGDGNRGTKIMDFHNSIDGLQFYISIYNNGTNDVYDLAFAMYQDDVETAFYKFIDGAEYTENEALENLKLNIYPNILAFEYLDEHYEFSVGEIYNEAYFEWEDSIVDFETITLTYNTIGDVEGGYIEYNTTYNKFSNLNTRYYAPISIKPTVDNNTMFIVGDSIIDLNISKTNSVHYELINFVYETDDKKILINFNEIYDGSDDFKFEVEDDMLYIYTYSSGNLVLKDTRKFTITNNYSVGFELGDANDTHTETRIYEFNVTNDYLEYEDIGVNAGLGLDAYDSSFMVGSVDANVIRDMEGVKLQAKRSNGKGYLIPTVNGDYNYPLIMKYSSSLEFDYIYNEDPNSNNAIMVVSRLGSQSESIRFNDLDIDGDIHIKIVVTNEFEQVGTQDMTANIKVYLADINPDDVYTPSDYELVVDKDVSVSLLRAGYYYAFKQQYKDSVLQYVNYKIKKNVYDYNVEVICRGYDENGVIEVSRCYEKSVMVNVNTNHNKLVANFTNVESKVKYIDFLIIFRDDRLTKIEISRIMLSDGVEDAPYSLDKKIENLEKIDINFHNSFYANYYNSSSSDPVGLCIIRPTLEPISLTKLYAPEISSENGTMGVTVLYPYLKNAKEENKPENVGIEYLNSTNQELKLIYNG